TPPASALSALFPPLSQVMAHVRLILSSSYPSVYLNPLSIFDSPNRLLYGLTPHFMFTPLTVTMRLFICLVTVAFVLTNEFSKTGVHGTSLFFQDTLVEFPSRLSNQANIHSSSSSSLSHKYATVSPVFSLNNMFSGTVEIHLVSRSIIVSIEVDLVNLELSTLKKFSDNSTLVRAINNDIQNKEIYGSVNISFLHFLRCCNVDTDSLAKTILGNSSVMDPTFGPDLGLRRRLSLMNL
ncbi:hypothetical protein HID58_006200, partial [Brassica napus]